MKPNCTVSIRPSLAGIHAPEWNQLTDPNFPFLDYEWLSALETSGCVGQSTGWTPFYITLWQDHTLCGALVTYEKEHGRGEFLYDWHWETAYDRANAPYYPKGIVVAPFTPATGNRLMAPSPSLRDRLLQALTQLGNQRQWQSTHFGFISPQDQIHIDQSGALLPRMLHQFHWTNQGYTTFEDFLMALKSSRRKQVKKERNRVKTLGLRIVIKPGSDLTQTDIEALSQFYFATHDKNWGTPFLNLGFFERIAQTMPDRLICVLAYDAANQPVAGTLNLVKGDTLYGRYWGTTGQYPDLHFECCYYQLIEYAIQHKLKKIEAGAQGEHKFFRGFNATPVWFAHTFAWPSAQTAIRDFLIQETNQITSELQAYEKLSAYHVSESHHNQ